MPNAETNRQNAQSSTGPKSEEGKKRSSLNAVRHGFTGQTLVLSDAEKASYETHCAAYMEIHQPVTHEESELIQQYTDLRWTIHQISVQQSNILAIINAVTVKLMAEGEIDSLLAATAPYYKTLQNLATYEQRRRRAADATLAQFQALAEARREAREKDLARAIPFYLANKKQDKTFLPDDFGFVCSIAEIEKHLARKAAAAEVQKYLSGVAAAA